MTRPCLYLSFAFVWACTATPNMSDTHSNHTVTTPQCEENDEVGSVSDIATISDSVCHMEEASCSALFSPDCVDWVSPSTTFEDILVSSGWMDDTGVHPCAENLHQPPEAYRCDEPDGSGPIDVLMAWECDGDRVFFVFGMGGDLISIQKVAARYYSRMPWCCDGVLPVWHLVRGELLKAECDEPSHYAPEDFQ